MKTKLLIVLIALCEIANAQWQWAKSAGGTDLDCAFSVTTDASGNIYTAGYFYSSSITFGSTTLANAGGGDMFIVKYNATGNALWAKSHGGTFSDEAYSVSTDTSGNIYVTGSFYSPSITFGSDTLINTFAGSSDLFIVKYDAQGNVLWAKGAGGASADIARSVTTDASGNIYVTGYFSSPSVTFGSTTLMNTTNTYDIFIVKYDAGGNVLWAKSAGGGGWDQPMSVTADAWGNITVVGYFGSFSIPFGFDTLINANPNTTGYSTDMFIVKYDASGNVLWAESAGGIFGDVASSVTVDSSGNSYVAGSFSSPAIAFGSDTLTNSSGAGLDLFIVKYDVSGNVLWAKSVTSFGSDYAYSIAADASGNIIVAGVFVDYTFTFGSITLINANAMGGDDVFIVKYDAGGNVLWAESAGGLGSDYAISITVDPSGNAYLAGYFHSSTITFGSTTLTNAAVGNPDIFLAKLSSFTGIEENNFENTVTIYPNPSDGKFRIESETKINEIEIMNVVGEKIYSSILNNHSSIITLDSRNGIYFLQLITEQGMATKKIIINH
jgi:hypothetical protein